MTDPLSSGERRAGRRLAAIVFSDVVGYSARMQSDENGTLALVHADFERMTAHCVRHGGEVLNTMGDGMLLCFDSAVQAVTCALAMQAEFGRRQSEAPSDRHLTHRIGVHLGDVFRQTSGGVAGDGVNIAARLQTTAPTGGVCISQTVYDTVKGKVPMQALLVGPQMFKNIAEPITVWHIAAEGAPAPVLPDGRRVGTGAGATPRSGSRGGPATSDPTAPGIPDYDLLRKIGSGSYGDVWLARGLTGAYRAVKVVWRNRFSDAEPYEREFRGLKEFSALSLEASQMALLHVGQDERAGFFYYVMELADDAVTGRTFDPARYVPLTAKELKARRGRLPAAECVAFGVELARSLAGLHTRALLHRDIKPSNVIVVGGVPKLADIGLVASSTDARTFVGTEGYVPPEGPGAPTADVFALGKVLYELATGLDRAEFPKLPEDLGEPKEQKALFQLNEVFLRACEAKPLQRYRDASALLADLEALQAGHSVRRASRWPLVAAAAVVVVAGGAAFFALRPAAPIAPPPVAKAEPKAVEAPKPRGLAVLPFQNLDSEEQRFFVAGVTEEVIQHLSKVSALRLMSSAAVARFPKGAAELPAMTRELGIGALLTGTVRRGEGKVRIGVQLLAAPGGEILWSEQYDRDAKDTFAVQTDVAMRVVQALRVTLPPKERARIMRPPTENLAAYELWERARRTRAATEALKLHADAVALDPKFALAYVSMATIHVFRGYSTGRADLERALEFAQKAVAADPESAVAQHRLATCLMMFGKVEDSRRAFQRAIELNPSFSSAFNDFAIMELNVGQLDGAVRLAHHAFKLAPNLANSYYHLAAPLMLVDDQAAERLLKAGEVRFPVTDPTRGDRIQTVLAWIEMRRGQMAAAMQRMRDAVEALPKNGELQRSFTDVAFVAGAPEVGERVDQAMKTGPGARISYSGYTPRAMRAFLWLKSGDQELAKPLIEAALAENRAAMAAGDRSAFPLYENAGLLLMQGDRAGALKSLEDAYAAGYRDADFTRVDPFLTPLATDPQMVKLLERMDANVLAMRARLDLRGLDELAKGGK